MGFFRTSPTDSEFQNPGLLASIPIERYSCRNYSAPDVRTILHRLGALIFKTAFTRTTRYDSVMVAKWFLNNLPTLQLSAYDRSLTVNFQNQLRDNIARWERETSTIADPSEFQQMIDFAGYTNHRIMSGPPLFWTIELDWNTPMGRVSKTLSWYAWRQATIENWRI